MVGNFPTIPAVAVKLPVSDPALAGGYLEQGFHLPLVRRPDVITHSLQFPCHS